MASEVQVQLLAQPVPVPQSHTPAPSFPCSPGLGYLLALARDGSCSGPVDAPKGAGSTGYQAV